MDVLASFTKEQRDAFDAIEAGKSIFLTGPGGTGKSYLLRAIYEYIPGRTGKHVTVTAMTGCAALLLGRWAKTLHAWAGVGLGRDPANALVAQIRKSRKTVTRWKMAEILVIDEVSMLTPDFLEKLDVIARAIRKDERPMGGLQMVFVGDFFQLPPVNKDKENEMPFAFESPLWSKIVQETIQLKTIMRQEDAAFQTILNEARIGSLSNESLAILRSRMNLPWQTMNIRPTLLFSRRAEVDEINRRNLKSLMAERHPYKAETVFSPTLTTQGLTRDSLEVKRAAEKMDKDGAYMEELILAKGAQVMLLTNLDHGAGLVNGSRGVVTGFNDKGVPLVQFRNGTIVPIPPTSWPCDDLDGVSRKQIPLKLAYAITIHKAQGATLDCALIDIGTNTFEYGQAYVALSRVKNLESLYVWDLDPSAFKAHPKVLAFYKSLSF